VNWDLGGSYWDKNNVDAQKAYTEFNPVEKVDQWNTPIMIIQGGKDFRCQSDKDWKLFRQHN